MSDAVIAGKITTLIPVDMKTFVPADAVVIQLENVIRGHTKFPRLFIPTGSGNIHLENMNGDIVIQPVLNGVEYLGMFRKFLEASDGTITSITVKT